MGLVHEIPANIWGHPRPPTETQMLIFLPYGRQEGDLSASKDQDSPKRQLCFSGLLALRTNFIKDFAPGHRQEEKPLLSRGDQGRQEKLGATSVLIKLSGRRERVKMFTWVVF